MFPDFKSSLYQTVINLAEVCIHIRNANSPKQKSAFRLKDVSANRIIHNTKTVGPLGLRKVTPSGLLVSFSGKKQKNNKQTAQKKNSVNYDFLNIFLEIFNQNILKLKSIYGMLLIRRRIVNMTDLVPCLLS